MPLNFERLWAKSRPPDEPLRRSMLLLGHLQDVYAAAERIVDATGEDQLRALGLEPRDYLARFRRCVLLAAAVHDLGKANDHFLGMLTRQRNVLQNPQGLRHEWVTILMLQSLKSWLLAAVAKSDTDFAIVEWAVAGHHPAPSHQCPPQISPPGAGVEINFLLGHPDGAEIIGWLPSVLDGVISADRPKCSMVCRTLAESNDVFAEIAKLWRHERQTWEARVRNSADRKLVAAVKNCLVAADIAGSALSKAKPDDEGRWNWIIDAFSNKPKPGNLEAISRIKLTGAMPRDFQLRVAASKDPVTFVKAGCGTGKTVAAYMWAARNHPTRRLYFCYPTTGTATEGFKDYLFVPEGEFGDVGARLFHSRRDIDFEIILGTGADSGTAEQDTIAKLESLEAWSTPIVACTVDTVLGIVQNNKRGLFAWPALAQSAFVFDEIHSYDDRLFGALLRFLNDLPGLPVLLMTASLPRAREDALRAALAKRSIALQSIDGPAELETLPRYHRHVAPNNDPLPLVADELNAGGKVLWVCNTVGRVTYAADRARRAGFEPLIYHSRFRYVDRVARHKEVVDAFTSDGPRSALAICSQVAEISLDLKGCTMLVTDLATVPATIQRLGRLNRQATSGDRTRPFVVIEPDGPKPHLPYTADDLQAARAWLGRLGQTNISQRELSEKWEQTADQPPETIDSAWMDGGPITSVKELRDLSPGISVLLREDVDRLLASRGKDNDIGRYVIPMNQPHGVAWQQWCQHKGIPIAEPGFVAYDGKRGAEWVMKKNLAPVII